MHALALAAASGGLLAWTLVDAARQTHIMFWPIYLTHWTLLAQTIYLCLRAAPLAASAPLQTALATAADRTWAIALPGSILVALLFWGGVIPARALATGHAGVKAKDFGVHGATVGLMLFDARARVRSRQRLLAGGGLSDVAVGGGERATYMAMAAPWAPRHGAWFVAYVAVYVAWVGAFDLVRGRDADGNPWIYRAMDWVGHAVRTAIASVCMIGLVGPRVVAGVTACGWRGG